MGPSERLISKYRADPARASGFTIVQVMVSMGMIVICGIAGVQALSLVNQKLRRCG